MKSTRSLQRPVVIFGAAAALALAAGCESSGEPERAPVTPGVGAPAAPGTGTPPPAQVAGSPGVSGTAGNVAPAPGPVAGAAAGPVAPGTPTMQPAGKPDPGPLTPQMPGAQAMPWPDPRNGCPGLDSGFPGDDACIAPPPPGEGLQIHIGPRNYDDPSEINAFLLGKGAEVSECWSYHTPNEQDVYFAGWTLSGRPGTHHIFNSMLSVEVSDGGGFHVCVDAGLGNSPNRLGSLPGAAKPYMPRRPTAPENEGLGQLLHAKQSSEADLHYFNVTDGDILREFWLNLYFIDEKDVTQQPFEVRGMGGLSWVGLPIAAGTDAVYQYECPIGADGRLTSLLGHFHAHGKRETVSLRHGDGTRQKLFEMYDYTNAAVFSFDSLSQNPPIAQGVDGAVSGAIAVKAGDVLEWECHIVNDGPVPLTYSNSVKEGEMCNVFGQSVGPEINCLQL